MSTKKGVYFSYTLHFTRMIGSAVHAGPNAVLSFKREGYKKSDFALRDALESIGYPGFWRLSARHWSEGLRELWRSLSKKAFTRSLQRLIPEVHNRTSSLPRPGYAPKL